MKYPAKTDIAVLLLFFTRSDTFRQVFDAVRQARPSKFLLYQDGPRDEGDMAGIEACREIVSDAHIDWECEVHRQYLDHNQGCDPSGFLSHQWAFSIADKVIVLEDDVVPSQSFFPFCKEMLDRYEHDERISMIAGFNIDEVTPDCSDSYFFTSAFSIWGWASWRRVAVRWDPDYDFIRDPKAMQKLERVAKERNLRKDMLQMFRDHSQSGKAYFETIYWSDMLLNDCLARLYPLLGRTEDHASPHPQDVHHAAPRTCIPPEAPTGRRREQSLSGTALSRQCVEPSVDQGPELYRGAAAEPALWQLRPYRTIHRPSHPQMEGNREASLILPFYFFTFKSTS